MPLTTDLPATMLANSQLPRYTRGVTLLVDLLNMDNQKKER